jgi:hypothetical protein
VQGLPDVHVRKGIYSIKLFLCFHFPVTCFAIMEDRWLTYCMSKCAGSFLLEFVWKKISRMNLVFFRLNQLFFALFFESRVCHHTKHVTNMLSRVQEFPDGEVREEEDDQDEPTLHPPLRLRLACHCGRDPCK